MTHQHTESRNHFPQKRGTFTIGVGASVT